jgi:hypothetical protein
VTLLNDSASDELTTAWGAKADTPDTNARESRSFMVELILEERGGSES